ncbi:MAG: hypothetical protein Q8K63_12055 [Acidimicrobiales bacterium]|nr:hypothetical protein [Acidimicrobiales bacterium]
MARRVAAALALLLFAAACGGAKDPEPGAGVGTATSQDSSSTTGSAGSDPTATTTRGASSPGTTDRITTRPTSGRSDSASKPLIDDGADRSVGGFAGLLLAEGVADRLVLDVRVGRDATASQGAIDAMAQALRTHSGKPVDVTSAALTGVDEGTHTGDEIRRLASNQGTPNRDGVAVLHVLYLGGQFEKDGTLGVAVRGDTVALFPDAVDQAVSPFASRSRIEHAIAVHELGHVLGLVDLYLDRDRADPDHPGHSANRNSVMFWAVETSLVGQVLGGPPAIDFDAEDVADLKQIRAGAARA